MKKAMRLIGWLVFLLLMFFSIATNPFANTSTGDSSFFSYIGRRWCEGYVPYRDYFDHKGPMIFFINMLGQLPGHYFFFLWLIECAFVVLSIYAIYKFVKKWFPNVENLAVQLPVAALVWSFLSSCYGNMNESYAFLFILLPLLSLLGNILRGSEVTKLESFLHGCAFMAIFLFRANMVIIAFVVAIYYIHEFILTKSWKNLLCRGLLTAVGMAVILVPFVAYFYCKDALYDMWYASILFNLKYAGQQWHWSWCFYPVFSILGLNVFMLFISQDDRMKKAMGYNLVFLFLTLLVLLKQPFYAHYFVIAVPGLILPLAAFYDRIQNRRRIIEWIFVFPSYGLIGLALLGANFDIGGYLNSLKRGERPTCILKYKEGSNFSDARELSSFIDDKNSVFVYGNQQHIYQYLGISGTFKYFGHTVGEAHVYDPSIRDAVRAHIEQQKDRYVIVCGDNEDMVFLPLIYEKYVVLKKCGQYVLLKRKL